MSIPPEQVPSSIEKIFPGFTIKSVTFIVSLIQVSVFISSLIQQNQYYKPTQCSLYILGANFTPAIINQNEWYRLVTPILLHGSIFHLIVSLTQLNLFFQLRLGFIIESYYHSTKFFFIYLISGIGGNLLTAVIEPYKIAIGASTSLYGLLGAYGSYFIYSWEYLGPGRHLNLLLYGFAILMNFTLAMYVPIIDVEGHLGGFVVGLALGLLYLERREDLNSWTKSRIGALLFLVAFFAGLTVLLIFLGLEHCSDYGLTADCEFRC